MATQDTQKQARTALVSVRVTPDEKRKIRGLANAKDTSESELLHGEVVGRVVAEYDRLQEFLREAEGAA